MDNFFIAEYFDWRVKRLSLLDRIVSRALTKLGRRTKFRSADFVDSIYTRVMGNAVIPTESGAMTNIEQRMNMYHLASQVLAYGVQGDFVELGCNTGDSSILIKKLLQAYGSDKIFSVYDSFEGLPSARQEDGTRFKGGDLKTSEDILRIISRYIIYRYQKFTKDGFKIRCQPGFPNKLLLPTSMEISMIQL